MAQAQQTDQDTAGKDLSADQLLWYFAEVCRSHAAILAAAAAAESPRALSLAESALFLSPRPSSDHADSDALAGTDTGRAAGWVVRGGCDPSASPVPPDG